MPGVTMPRRILSMTCFGRFTRIATTMIMWVPCQMVPNGRPIYMPWPFGPMTSKALASRGCLALSPWLIRSWKTSTTWPMLPRQFQRMLSNSWPSIRARDLSSPTSLSSTPIKSLSARNCLLMLLSVGKMGWASSILRIFLSSLIKRDFLRRFDWSLRPCLTSEMSRKFVWQPCRSRCASSMSLWPGRSASSILSVRAGRISWKRENGEPVSMDAWAQLFGRRSIVSKTGSMPFRQSLPSNTWPIGPALWPTKTWRRSKSATWSWRRPSQSMTWRTTANQKRFAVP